MVQILWLAIIFTLTLLKPRIGRKRLMKAGYSKTRTPLRMGAGLPRRIFLFKFAFQKIKDMKERDRLFGWMETEQFTFIQMRKLNYMFWLPTDL